MRLGICVFIVISTVPPIENYYWSLYPSVCNGSLKKESEEIIAETGSDVVFSCPSGQFRTEPYWQAPDILPDNLQRDDYEQLLNERITESFDNDSVIIQNLNYAYSGRYFCKSEMCLNASSVSSYEPKCACINGYKETYLYVKDDTRLSFISTKLFSADVLTSQGEESIIPCRPTSPDVKVELFIGESQDPETQTKVLLDVPHENGVVYNYDPRIGFKFNTNQTAVQFYTCKFSRNNQQEILTSRLIVMKRSELSLGVWSIWFSVMPITKTKNKVEDRLIIECKITTEEKITVEWVMTPQKVSDDRIQIFEKIQPQNNETISWYSVTTLKEEDQGYYYCKVIFGPNDFIFRRAYISVSNLEKYFINIVPNQNDNITDLWSDVDGVSIQWQMRVNGFPDPLVFWNRNHDYLNTSSKYLVEFTPPEARLKIKNISVEDFGNYTFAALNLYTTKLFNYTLNMTSSPLIRLEVADLSQDLIKCVVVAFPEPTISWFFEDGLGQNIIEDNLRKNGIQWTSYIQANSSWRGSLTCQANNSLGQAQVTQEISGYNNDFEIYGPNNTVNFYDGSKSLDAKFYENINFTCIFPIRNVTDTVKWFHNNKPLNMKAKITNENAVYINRSILTISNVTDQNTGIYSCILTKIDAKTDFRSIRLVAGHKGIATNITSNLNGEAEVGLKDDLKFDCNVSGYPSPAIKWSKANATIEPSEKFKIKNYNQTLIVKNITEADFGMYRCKAFNGVGGIVYKEVNLKLKHTSISNYFWVIVTVILLVLLISTLIFTAVKVRNERKLQEELKLLGLENFEKGDLEKLNPELGLEEQAEFLPYDMRFEIPVEKLQLGKQLGSGAFGVVFKGQLEEIPVAVKTISKIADLVCFKALISELKIMIHIGKHVNIVNLLGACTKNIAKKELFVIVEYCPFGNLQHYLQGHKEELVDQITKRGYAEDLIAWSFQVALGMEYLASKKVLHGDLAARNVLLANCKIVKICDFGLARNMYYADIYKKTEQIPLPVKWMAIESITYKIFSTKSDVWSFGILLWELFSFGKTPYPGMDVNETFYEKLTNGYRMESPEYASDQIYQIMLDCWNFEPQNRPSFTELAARLSLLLEKPVTDYYVTLNSHYLSVTGKTYQDEGYMGMEMLNCSNLQHFYKNIESNSSYLSMTSNTKTDQHNSQITAPKQSYHNLDGDPECSYTSMKPSLDKISQQDDEEFEATAMSSASLFYLSNPSYYQENSDIYENTRI